MKSLPGPRPLPLVGNLLKMPHATLHLQLEEWARTYGDAYLCYFGSRPGLIISNPEVIRKVFLDRPGTFRRSPKMLQVMTELMLNGVFVADGDDWRRQRKLINFGFAPDHLGNYYPMLATITQRLTEVLGREGQNGASVDVLPVLMRYTVDVTSILSFGMDLDTLRQGSHPLQKHVEQFLPAISQRMLAPFPYWKLLPSARRMDHALAETRKAIQELIEKGRRDLELEPERATKPRNLLDAMLAAQDEEAGGARLTDDEVFANVLTMLVGGEDNTADTITWMLYYLAKLPAVQAQARQELDVAVASQSVPAMEHFKQMPYMAGVTQEALRLRAPAATFYLEAGQDTVVGDVAVPKGTMVVALTRLPGLNNAYFGDPENFRPERWMPNPPPDVLPHSPRHMLMFGAGGRTCPGRNLTSLLAALATGTVLRAFELELADPNAPVGELMAFSVTPVGVNLRFKPRAST